MNPFPAITTFWLIAVALVLIGLAPFAKRGAILIFAMASSQGSIAIVACVAAWVFLFPFMLIWALVWGWLDIRGTEDHGATEPDELDEPKSQVGEYVEAVVADLAGLLTRTITTTGFLVFAPKRARSELSQSGRARLRYFLRPHTYLLLGCLLYSAFLGAMSRTSDDPAVRGFSHKDTSELLTAELQELLTDGASVVALVIKTLPILAVATLAAILAGWVFRKANGHPREHFLFLFGLQGLLIFVIALATESLGDAFQFIFGSDDYILIAFPLISIALLMQTFRWFRANATPIEFGWTQRLQTLALYLVLFLVPLPLAGVAVGKMERSVEAIQPENRQIPGLPPVRVVEFEATFPEQDVIELKVLAAVENRTERVIALRVEDIRADVYFVTTSELNSVSVFSRSIPSLAYRHIDFFDRFTISLVGFLTIDPAMESRIAFIDSGAEQVLAIRGRAKLKKVNYFPNEFSVGRTLNNSDEAEEYLRKQRQLVVEALGTLPETGKLKFLADGNWVIIKLGLPDRLSRHELESLYWRSDHRVSIGGTE